MLESLAGPWPGSGEVLARGSVSGNGTAKKRHEADGVGSHTRRRVESRRNGQPFHTVHSGEIFRDGTHPQTDALWPRSRAEIVGVTTNAIRAVVRFKDVRCPSPSVGPFPWGHGLVRKHRVAEAALVALDELEAVRTHGQRLLAPDDPWRPRLPGMKATPSH